MESYIGHFWFLIVKPTFIQVIYFIVLFIVALYLFFKWKLQTLAGICYAVDNSGDTTLSDGTSNLVSAISMITSEVNLEVERLKLQKSKFGKLEWLPVIPIFALSPIKSFFITNIPGTATIYNGMSGYLIVVGILFTSVVCYKAITTITRPVAIKYDDRTNLDRKLMSNRDVRRFVTAIVKVSMMGYNTLG